jgi:hypothetical protein
MKWLFSAPGGKAAAYSSLAAGLSSLLASQLVTGSATHRVRIVLLLAGFSLISIAIADDLPPERRRIIAIFRIVTIILLIYLWCAVASLWFIEQ